MDLEVVSDGVSACFGEIGVGLSQPGLWKALWKAASQVRLPLMVAVEGVFGPEISQITAFFKRHMNSAEFV